MRNSFQILAVAAVIAAGTTLAGGAAQAGKFKVLHSFCESTHRVCGDGSQPSGALVMDAAGNFYGATATGGLGAGTVFELERKPGGAFNFKTLYRFCSQGTCGYNASGALIVDASGNLYGTATNVVFELSPGTGKKGEWGEKILYRFCSQQNCTDGNVPTGGLTYAGASSGAPYDGVSPLYGVTASGGANNGGTVFEIQNSTGTWSESVLYSFCSQGGDKCTDGKEPLSGLLMDASGNLFGTGYQGGNNVQAGTAFELSLTGNKWGYVLLYNFCSAAECADGGGPYGPLIFDSDRSLLGTTGSGGAKCRRHKSQGCGTIFKIAPNGAESQETVLHSFCQQRDCRDGAGPGGGVTMGETGEFYGTTANGGGHDTDDAPLGGGTIFKLSSASFDVLHRFCAAQNCADGERPESRPILDSTGRAFATSAYGGEFGNGTSGGTVFRLIN